MSFAVEASPLSLPMTPTTPDHDAHHFTTVSHLDIFGDSFSDHLKSHADHTAAAAAAHAAANLSL
ncbi:hypothetical protein LPJ53_003644, partial [Coemansia erecta]